MNLAKVGATFFVLWGLLHILGGITILMAVAESPAQGYALYEQSTATYTELSGAILGYLAYSFLWIAIAVTYIGIRYNWHNDQHGLALNTVLVGMTDLGLVIYLVWPGFLSWGQASPGLILFACATVFGGLACQSSHRPVGESA